jgi:tetratricopeptide (TPR) repeat protein
MQQHHGSPNAAFSRKRPAYIFTCGTATPLNSAENVGIAVLDGDTITVCLFSLESTSPERKGGMHASALQRQSPRRGFWCAGRHARSRRAILALCFGLLGSGATAADLEDAAKLFRTGKYEDCAKAVELGIENDGWSEPWRHLAIKTELARGRDKEAIAALEEALLRFPASISLHLLGSQVYRQSGHAPEAAVELDTLANLIQNSPRRYSTAEGLVTIGRFFLLRGADARKVLDQFYDVVTKQAPDFLEAYFATAEMALDKEDYALASETLRKAPKAAAVDPRFHCLMARALANDDRPGAAKELTEALKINPKHVDSLLLVADELIDRESYPEADKALKQAFEVNPREPRAFAYQAVLAHLRNDSAGETAARKKALERWEANPEVDHLIGRKLSQKYRFAEGSERQKQALLLDSEYQPAKLQLCQDLLRLGEEADGWKIAAEIFSKDGYNVVAYNLVTLRDRLAGFRTLEGEGFIVRMESREADLYGSRVLALLKRARETLVKKYGVALKEPVIVEVFPQQKEFAVRTFGLPGAEGLLGVCFGRVVTARSPASQADHPSNWEAVLWHEFCHVVTLGKTRNKMPRWLSEGISVYEEGQEDRTWATAFDPRYRVLILSDGLKPLSSLSSAFLTAKTPLDVQFAYFESALAVEFLIEQFGLPTLKGLLDDLGAGTALNQALPIRTKKTLDQIDGEFARFARERAESVAPGATWEEPDLPVDADSSVVKAWLDKHPKSFWGLKRFGASLVVEGKWAQAKDVLERLKAIYPEYVGPENAYLLLAMVYKRLPDPVAERKILEELAMRDGDANPAYLRLMEVADSAGDWRSLSENARRSLAVNPLIPAPFRGLAHASERLGAREDAIAAYRALAILDDTDPAGVRYHLASLLRQAGKPQEARREVLKSLEQAPRFREAHQLLLELLESEKPVPPTPKDSPVH